MSLADGAKAAKDAFAGLFCGKATFSSEVNLAVTEVLLYLLSATGLKIGRPASEAQRM